MASKPESDDKPKKGRPSWKPFKKLDVADKDPNFRYRWVLRDASRLEQARNEGWEFVNSTTGIKGQHSYPGLAADGKTLESTATYREHVLMAMPKEMVEARDAYYQELTDRRSHNLVNNLRSEIKDEAQRSRGVVAPVHGTITIS